VDFRFFFDFEGVPHNPEVPEPVLTAPGTSGSGSPSKKFLGAMAFNCCNSSRLGPKAVVFSLYCFFKSKY
jgi:hypothetical protein